MPRISPSSGAQSRRTHSDEDSFSISFRLRSKRHFSSVEFAEDENEQEPDSDSSFNNSSRYSCSPSARKTLYPNLDSSGSMTPETRDQPRKHSPDIVLENLACGRNKFYPDLSESQSHSDSSFTPKTLIEVTEQKKQPESSSNIALMVMCILICFGIVYLVSSPIPSADYSSTSSFQSFVEKVNDLQEKFPQQPSRLWKTFKASAKHILNDTKSLYPSVILMASDVHNTRLASCLAVTLAAYFEASHGLVPQYATTNVETIQAFSKSMQKQKLDDSLRQALQRSGSKAFVLENLQLLSAEAALLLHGYCDGDNAPFKDVMLVLVLVVDNTETVLDPTRVSEVEHHLARMWTKSLHEDKVGALLSRVANNIVVVTDEVNDSWKNICK